MIQGKMEELDDLSRSFGGYKKGAVLSSQKEEEVEDKAVQSGEQDRQVGYVAMVSRIMDEQDLRRISGWQGEFKSSTLKKTIESLNTFHQEMKTNINFTNLEEGIKEGKNSYHKLLEKVSHYVERGSSKYADIHIHRKEEKAMLPVMSTLLISLYSLGNVFDYLENLAYDFLMKNQEESATLREIITGREALSVRGNMASTKIQEPSSILDKTAYQMKKRNSKEEVSLDKRQELYQRKLPVLKGKGKEDIDDYLQELKAIATMVDDLELQSSSDMEREDVKIDFIDIEKMIHVLLHNPFLLQENGSGSVEGAFRDSDLAEAAEYARITQGMTVKEGLQIIDEIRKDKAETAAKESIKNGGAMSQVLIDLEKKRVLRTAKNKEGVKGQRQTNNFNYDEAMSRLGEITGLGSQAGARSTYYKDIEGTLQYGTNMQKAEGKEGYFAKLSFGEKKADSVMREGRHNIFGHNTKEEMERNAKLIYSSFNMQILDYIAFHQDRKANNYFVNLEAEDPLQAFMGIDNDNVFGKGVAEKKIDRVLSYKSLSSQKYRESGSIRKEGDRDYRDSTSTLFGFHCIPKETLDQINNLDEKKIETYMEPYLDRAARFELIHRIQELKKYVSNKALVFDLHTEEGMEEFKKETMKMTVYSIIDNAQTFHKDDTIQLHGGIGLRSGPSVLIRTFLANYFGSFSGGKDGKYHQNDEYNTEGMTKQQFYGGENRRNFNNKLWVVFDAMMEAGGMTREQVWEEIEKLSYMQNKTEEEKRMIKKAFLEGLTSMYGNWNLKPY